MPVLKVKNENGVWQDIATANSHAHTVSDISDLPASLVDDVEALKDKVGAESVAYQITTAVEANKYTHPETHPATMITGLSAVAISGSYNDLADLPTIDEVAEQVQSDWDETDTTSPAYIKNKPTISGDGGASVQANWEQTDESQPDYIKNKPFYDYEGQVDILPLTRYENFTLDSNFGVYGIADSPTYNLTIGETYIVNWDGTDWTCIAQDASSLMSGTVSIGNLTNFGLSGNGEPFVIGVIDGLGVQYFSLTDTEAGGSHEVRIYQEATLSKHIDSKYLPEHLQFGEGETIFTELIPSTNLPFNYSENDGGYSSNMTPPSDYIKIWNDDWTEAEVVWDGTTYTCQAQYYQGIKVVGNLGLMMGGENTGEPFVMMMADAATIGEDICSIISLADEIPEDVSTAETKYHDVSVSICKKNIVKLPLKYSHRPDWNEWDSSSGSYIANRPFSEIPAGTVVLPETTVNCAIQDTDTIYFCILSNPLNIGAFAYNVEFDGVAYDCVGVIEDDIVTLKYDGDDAFFNIGQNVGGSGMNIVVSTQGEHTLKITLAEDVVQKIDAKYIPEIDGLPKVTTDDNDKVLKVVDGAWAIASSLPNVTTSDAGKFLRVGVDGNWVVETVLNAEEVSF